jgi:hypothetical protein
LTATGFQGPLPRRRHVFQIPGFILHERRADDSNATGIPAQSLAATPSALTGSLSLVLPIRQCSP